MKKLLVLIAAACLMVPAMAFAQSDYHVYMEIYTQTAEDPPPPEACICPGPPLNCFAQKAQYTFAFCPIHIGKCPDGFKGIDFGVVVTGESVMSMVVLACPGFMYVPITEFGELYIGSTTGCHLSWMEHPGYVRAFAFTAAGQTQFDLTPAGSASAINVNDCVGGRNDATYVHGAQWGGTQTIVCGDDPTPVELTTWGAIKDLFR